MISRISQPWHNNSGGTDRRFTGFLVLAALLLLTAVICTSCSRNEKECTHDWQPATCTEPATCSKCGATQGEPLGHTYSGTSCTGTDICAVCGAILQAQGHVWVEATCTEPKTCSRCGATQGEPLGHNYVGGICSRCGDQLFSTLERSGSGDTVADQITVGADFYTLHFEGSGSGKISVTMTDSTGAQALLVSDEDSYEGTVLIYGASPLKLDIQCSGDWSYVIDKVPVKGTAEAVSGHGDSVAPAAPYRSGRYRLQHSGTGAFYVYAFAGGESMPVQMPATGPCDTEVVLDLPDSGNVIFEVHATGDWSITPVPES